MTVSTVPITLPARHRVDAPIWRLHVEIAWVVYAAALAGWSVATFTATHGRRHLVVMAAAVALVVVAIAAIVALR